VWRATSHQPSFLSAVAYANHHSAVGGSLMLEEIGEIPLAPQPTLLHVLQDKKFERIGRTE